MVAACPANTSLWESFDIFHASGTQPRHVFSQLAGINYNSLQFSSAHNVGVITV